MRQSLVRFCDYLLRHRALVLGLHGCLLLLAGVGASRVQVDYDIEDVFERSDPDRKVYDAYKSSFPKEDGQVTLLWHLEAPLDVADVYAMGQAARSFERIGLSDVRWLATVEAARASDDGDGLSIRPLIEPEGLHQADLEQALRRFRHDPLYEGVLWNADQSVFAMHAHVPVELNDANGRGVVEVALSEAIEELRSPGRKLTLTGLPIVRARMLQLIDGDMALFLGSGVLLMFVVLFVALGSVSQVLMCLAAILPAYVGVLGVMGFAGVHVSILTSFIPIIVLVVGVCDAVHLLTEYRRRRGDGDDAATAARGALSELVTPCAYTSLTTAVGFAALISTGIGVVVDFGLFAAIGVLFTFFYVVTLLPPLLSFQRAPVSTRRSLARSMDRFVNHAAGAFRRRGHLVFGLTSLLLVLSLGLAGRVHKNVYMVDDIAEDQPIRADLRAAEQAGFGVFQLNVWLRGADEPVHTARGLAFIDELQNYLQREPLVVKTRSLVGPLAQIRAALLEDPDERVAPRTNAEASQLLLLANMGSRRWVKDLYLEAANEAQVQVFVRDAGSEQLRPLIARLRRRLAEHPPPGGSAELTGTPVLVDNVYRNILSGFGSSVGLAIGCILLILSWMFRSLKQGLLALIPNVLPLVALFGVLGATGWALKPSTMLVFSVAFGVAVDDSIHLLGRFRQRLRDGESTELALSNAIQHTGRAVVLTSLVLVLGFALLLGSEFEMLQMVGVLTSVSVVLAVLADLYLYPALVWALRARAPLQELTRASLRKAGVAS